MRQSVPDRMDYRQHGEASANIDDERCHIHFRVADHAFLTQQT